MKCYLLITFLTACVGVSLALNCGRVPCNFCNSVVSGKCPDRCAACNGQSSQSKPSDAPAPAPVPAPKSKSSPGGKPAPAPAPAAKSAKSAIKPKWANKDYPITKNEVFQGCCKKYVNKGCHSLCKYEVTLAEIDDAIYTSKTCDWSFVNHYMYCAGDGVDNTECCKQNGMGAEGRTHCLKLCQPSGITILDEDHLKCFSFIDKIMQCHKATVLIPLAKKHKDGILAADAEQRTFSSGDGDKKIATPKPQQLLTDAEANAKFRSCCVRTIAHPGCHDLCDYDVTLQQLRNAVWDPPVTCPLSTLSLFMYCASDDIDNTECCRKAGLFSIVGPQCKPFCSNKPNLGTLGISHISCAGNIRTIMDCHRNGIR